MNRLTELYYSGKTYLQYVEAAETADRDKHLHYLHKMKLSEQEKQLVLDISDRVNLLVFCNIACRDCRIVLAVLENIRMLNPLMQYRIVDREGNRDIMQQIDKNCRIPLIIDITKDKYNIVFNEIPQSVQEKMKKLHPDEVDIMRQNFRRGLLKAEIMNQLLDLFKEG